MQTAHQMKRYIPLIAVISLLLCLSAMLVLKSYQFRNRKAYGYNNTLIAKHIVDGKGFKLTTNMKGELQATAITPPGYVYFVALIFSLFGSYTTQSAIAIEILQSITTACTCIVLYLIGRRVHEMVGLLSAIALAVYPAAIFFSVMRIGPALLVVLLVGLIMYYLLKIQARPTYRDAAICGLLMGLNALFEPAIITFYVLACVWLFAWISTSRMMAVKLSFLMGFVCILCVIPWTIRNYVVFNAFVPMKSSMGRNLLEGNTPYGNGVIHHFDHSKLFTPEERREMYTDMNEVQRNKVMQSKAIEIIKDNPQRFLQSSIKRFYAFWAPGNPYKAKPYQSIQWFAYTPFLLLGFIGIILGYKKWSGISLIFCFLLSYPFPFYLTHFSINRYQYIVEPFLILLTCYAIVDLFHRYRGQKLELAVAE